MSKITARALYDNVADTPDELAFRKGDLLVVLDQNPAGLEGQGWWLCSLRGREGLCPGNRLLTLPCGVYQAKQSVSTTSLNSVSSAPVWNSSSGSTSSETSSSSSLHYRSPIEVAGPVQNRKVMKPVRIGDTFSYASMDRGQSGNGSHGGEGVDLPDYDVPKSRPVLDHGGDSIPCYDVPKSHNDVYDSPRPMAPSPQPLEGRGRNSDRSSGVSLLSSSSGYSMLSNTSSDGMSISSIYANARNNSVETYDVPRPSGVLPPKMKVQAWGNRSFDETGAKLRHFDVEINKSFDSLDLYDFPVNRSIGTPSPRQSENYDVPPRHASSLKLDSIMAALSDFTADPTLKLPPKTRQPQIVVDSETQDYDTPVSANNFLRNKLGNSFRSHRSGVSQLNHIPLPPKVGRRPISTDSELMQDYSIPHPRGLSPPVRENSKSDSAISENEKEKSEPVYGIIRKVALSEIDQGLLRADEIKSKAVLLLEKVLELKLKPPFTESFVNVLKEVTTTGVLSFERLLELALTHVKAAKKIDSALSNRFEVVVKPLINGRRILRDILHTLESIPINVIDSPTFQKRLMVTFDQLIVCTKTLIEDIKAFSICLHDNAKKIFHPPPEEWIDDYDYVKLDSRSEISRGDVVAESLPVDLQATYYKMVKDSTSYVPANPTASGQNLFAFYKPYVQDHRKLLANSIDTFISVVESKEQPSVFINFARFIVINAFKLVFIGDSIARHTNDENAALSVGECSEKLCNAVKLSVEAINRGARDFPVQAAVQMMFDAVVHVAERGTEFHAVVVKYAG